MLGENRFTKYLLYAIGEIILVVIGILIALQINNWNEGRKDRTKEVIILEQLRSEFNSNLEQLDQKIRIRNVQLLDAQKLLSYIDDPASRIKDSVEKAMTSTIGYATFDPIENDLAASGSLRLIQNDSLKSLLSRWTSELVQVTESEQTWHRYRDNQYLPFLIQRTQLRSQRDAAMKERFLGQFLIDVDNDDAMGLRVDSLGTSAYEYNIEVLMSDPDFEDHLVRCIVTNNISNVQSHILRKRIILILEILDKELNGAADFG